MDMKGCHFYMNAFFKFKDNYYSFAFSRELMKMFKVYNVISSMIIFYFTLSKIIFLQKKK